MLKEARTRADGDPLRLDFDDSDINGACINFDCVENFITHFVPSRIEWGIVWEDLMTTFFTTDGANGS